MVDQRRPSSPSRGPRGRGPKRRGPEAPLTGPLPVDPSTADALALFNQRLTVQSDAERSERRIIKQTKIKDGAAAAVRAVEADTNATAEARNAAIESYKEAVAALDRAKRGEPDRPAAETAPSEEPASQAPPSDEAAPDQSTAADADTTANAPVSATDDSANQAVADIEPADAPESGDDETGAPAANL